MNEEKIHKIGIRTVVLFFAMIAVCVYISIHLFQMQIIDYKKYQSQVIDNIQQETIIPAERGVIYSNNMIQLATNKTAYRVFISPVDIENDEQAKEISKKLSEILSVDYESVYAKAIKENRKDETIKRNVSEELANLVTEYIAEKKYTRQIHLEANTIRYYPYGSLASSVIGAMGTDGGLFGLELKYNDYLKGTPGRYITTKNAQSQNMPSSYDYYVDAKDGLNIVSTIDISIQSMLEEQLEKTYYDNKAGNKTAGIVIDVNTGAVLAMATYPTFDLNSPYVLNEELSAKLDNSGLDPESDEYNEYFWELVYSMWNNKTVSDLYEPGSTFKIITTAMALEENIITLDTTFTCNGKLTVGNYDIKCWVHPRKHGTHAYSYLLQQSCNPTLMQAAAMIGRETFYSYFTEFGYASKSGVDLPGEAAGIITPYSNFNAVELAVYSFGQTFKTSMVQHISAIAAVANGGHLVTPHLVSSLVDGDGNTVVSYETAVKKQIISSEVSKKIMDVLEDGVSGDGGAKNAYVAGYKIAAKTGTSEKRDKINPATGQKDYRVGSCVAIAPADDPKIAALIICDEPGTGISYGSTVAAPYIAELMEGVLPYLGVERNYTEEEMERIAVEVKNYKGYTLEKAIKSITELGLKYEVIGDGDSVTAQIPEAGQKMTKVNGKILLYTGNASTEENYKEVPNLVGLSASVALSQLNAAGFNVYIDGATNYNEGEGAMVISQSHKQGELLKKGSIITIVCRHMDSMDD